MARETDRESWTAPRTGYVHRILNDGSEVFGLWNKDGSWCQFGREVNEEATKVTVDDKGTKVDGEGSGEVAVNAGEEHKEADKSVPDAIGTEGGKEGETPKA
jgi:hypothetical protein